MEKFFKDWMRKLQRRCFASKQLVLKGIANACTESRKIFLAVTSTTFDLCLTVRQPPYDLARTSGERILGCS